MRDLMQGEAVKESRKGSRWVTFLVIRRSTLSAARDLVEDGCGGSFGRGGAKKYSKISKLEEEVAKRVTWLLFGVLMDVGIVHYGRVPSTIHTEDLSLSSR
jgi:hypothetical protein